MMRVCACVPVCASCVLCAVDARSGGVEGGGSCLGRGGKTDEETNALRTDQKMPRVSSRFKRTLGEY